MKLRDISVALPKRRVSSSEIAAWTGADPTFLKEKIGIESRAFLADDEQPVTLAHQACESLLGRNPALDRGAIELLVVVTQNPDYRLPHTSALLQHSLALRQSTGTFDISLGCSGFVYALSVTKGLMASEGLQNAILVTCDAYSKIMDRSDRDTVTIFGDAATASWISGESGARIGRFDFGTDGGGSDHLIVRGGGSAKPSKGFWDQTERTNAPEDLRLHMDGHAIFNFMMRRVPESVRACLEKNDLTMDQIDYFVFHQASRFLLENLRRRMGLEPERVPIGLRDVGNTVSSSIPLLLSTMLREGKLSGKRVLVSGFGVGLSWATNVLWFGGDAN